MMLEKPAPSAEQAATQWVGAFGLALTSGDEAALAELFLPDSRRASEVRASGFRLDTAALAPRRAVVAGREVIEAIICFDTSHGPGIRRRRHRLAAKIPDARRRLLFQRRMFRTDRGSKDPSDPGDRHRAFCGRWTGAQGRFDVARRAGGSGHRLQGPGSRRGLALRRSRRQTRRADLGF